MSKRTSICTLLLLTLLVPGAFAATGVTWLELTPGGRAAALGGAQTASVDGPMAPFWNPAAVGMDGNGAAVMHSNLWIDGTQQNVSSVFQLGKFGLGFSALHVSVDDMDLRSGPSTSPIGQFDARNYALGFSVSREVPGGLRIGVSSRYISESIYNYHADGWSLDAGVLKKGLFGDRLDLGATVRHLGDIDALYQEASDLPTTMTLGGQYRIGTVWKMAPKIMADLAHVRDDGFHAHAGLEVDLFDYLIVRGGYVSGYEGRSFAGGIGIRWEQWTFNYGFTPYRDDLGNSQRFSVTVTW